MPRIDDAYVERCLRELMGWADHISGSLVLDQPHARGKVLLLEELAPREELERVRFDARTLRYRLENLVANLRRPVDSCTPGAP